ncbi:dihydroorotase [Prochlorococcus marinus]|uniref:dihydroorotase n=1 Tax=Prochlorococcus marinus TaxID=1219 RepID=UPI0022B465F7|nr:dihydroorotase [Prochlorococcus marinus]
MNLSPEKITLRQPDDWHVHLRDGNILNTVVVPTARIFRRAVVMPNLQPPITTIQTAIAYKERILNVIPKELDFTPLMTLYLTETLSREVIRKGFAEGVFVAAKLYPANSTTNSKDGVTDIRNIYSLIETIEEVGLPLLIHGEVTNQDVDIFDREAAFIEQILDPLLHRFPALRVVLEHITTEDSVEYVGNSKFNIAATITPHHLHINRNAMFEGGIRSDFYCLPVAKREYHRLALRRAATSGKPCFFLGTDSAPHLRAFKETSCGCAGIFNALNAIESYAQVFEEEDALDRLEAFSSEFGPIFYGLPFNEKKITLIRKPHRVPSSLHLGKTSEHIVPFHAGEILNWLCER